MSILWKLRSLGKMPALRRAVIKTFGVVYRHGQTITIRFGPLKSMRWNVHRAHQFWMPLGAYEAETSEWLARNLRPGDCFFDVGANAGYFTLLGSRVVGEHGRVVAFEPIPENVEIIGDNIRSNDLTNAQLEPVALSNQNAEVSFTVEGNNANSHLSEVEIVHARSEPARIVKVQARTLDNFVAATGLVPDAIKVDVEGSELLVLEGARDTLRTHFPRLLVSTHSEQLREDTVQVLRSMGYDTAFLKGMGHEVSAVRGRHT